MAVSSAGLQPKSDCCGKAQEQLHSKLQTRPLVRDGQSQEGKKVVVSYWTKLQLKSVTGTAPDRIVGDWGRENTMESAL
jgi:hypothetical protein